MNFEQGTIKAVGLSNGGVVAEYELRTAGKPAKIILVADKNSVLNNWDDVAFVTVSVTDENGTLVPDASDLITFKTEGAGVLAAVDSADINSHEAYQGTTRRAFQGLCFAMLKANAGTGKITLTATAPDLKGGSIEVAVGRK